MITEEQKQLAELIKSADLVASADAGDFDTITEQLNAASIEQTDSTRKVMDDLIDRVGAINANTVLNSLHKAGRGEIPQLAHVAQLCASEWHNLSGVGSDVSRPGLQSLLMSLAAVEQWPEGLADSVRKIGLWHVSLADERGIEPPTADELRAAWTLYRLDQRTTNAAAIMRESISSEMSDTELADAWVAAWTSAPTDPREVPNA